MTLERLPCGACGHRNRQGAKICAACGHPLAQSCPQCRQENRAVARFCRCCGAALGGTPLLNGRYRVGPLLAQGGMGSVYLVRDDGAGGAVRALKEMDLAAVDPAERQEAVAGFRREASLLRTLRHPHLVQVFDHFAVRGKEYLVMEYVAGRTLDAHVGQGPRTEGRVLPLALQLCAVLDYLHSRTPPVIYRDLKPSNVMVEAATGGVKLIDFGIARFYKPGKQKDTKMLGTPGFAPPEQYGDGQTDARSDVFALGVTLHVLLTDYDVEQTPWSYPPVTSLNPEVSPQMERIIAKATQLHVAERYQAVADLRAELLACGLQP